MHWTTTTTAAAASLPEGEELPDWRLTTQSVIVSTQQFASSPVGTWAVLAATSPRAIQEFRGTLRSSLIL
jgi:hypothetical protein